MPTIEDVRRFWSGNPLFSGEGQHEVGTREWFIEHEHVIVDDCCAGEVQAIYSRDVSPATKLLDAGCGPGFWVRYFHRLGVNDISACDLTTTAVALTRRSLEIFGLTAAVEVGNVEQLPYPDASFDHINCQGVLHHTPDMAAALREFRRVLRPGGTVCFSVYYQTFLLRHPALLRAVLWAIAPLVALKGRGRETMLAKADAAEIVRMYDGRDNPIGFSYTVDELRGMVDGLFIIEEMEFCYFPRRVLPFPVPRWLHAWLSRHAGLMVIVRGRVADTIPR